MRYLILGLCLMAGGCASSPPPVRVVGDNYCSLAKNISWSTGDTRPTIRQIRWHNAKYRRVCGKRGRR
jgi:hypothetical protein